jgi:hypothetical protein
VELKTIDRQLPIDVCSPPSEEEPIKNPFVSAILILKEALKNISQELDSSDTSYTEPHSAISTESSTSISLDTLHFGMFFQQLAQLKEEGLLLPLIKQRREELLAQKEHWRPKLDVIQGENQSFYDRIKEVLNRGQLILNPSGAGSSYLIVDRDGTPHFVVKPVDGDIFCLNNCKEFGGPFNDSEHLVREGISLYHSAQIDAFCWEVARLCGLENTTPKTLMGILTHDGFYDLIMVLDPETQEQFILETGPPDFEKLCSIQEFIPDSQDLNELLHELYAQGLSDEEIAARFDQKEFEEVCLLLWLSYETDGHMGNFRVYVKRVNEKGEKIYGIKKIDNSLSFPRKHQTDYLNVLRWLPNALFPLSSELKTKIALTPIEHILDKAAIYELETCREPFKERIDILKQLAQREGITLAEVDIRISLLSQEKGKELALNSLTTQQILGLISSLYREHF